MSPWRLYIELNPTKKELTEIYSSHPVIKNSIGQLYFGKPQNNKTFLLAISLCGRRSKGKEKGNLGTGAREEGGHVQPVMQASWQFACLLSTIINLPQNA